MTDAHAAEVEDFGARVIGPPDPHIIETEVKDAVSLYDPRHERVLVLNHTASDVWLLCDGTQNLAGIVALLASAYQSDPENIRPDIVSAIHQFVDEGFLPAP